MSAPPRPAYGADVALDGCGEELVIGLVSIVGVVLGVLGTAGPPLHLERRRLSAAGRLRDEVAAALARGGDQDFDIVRDKRGPWRAATIGSSEPQLRDDFPGTNDMPLRIVLEEVDDGVRSRH